MCRLCEEPEESRFPLESSVHATDVIDCIQEHFGIVYKTSITEYWFEDSDGNRLTPKYDSRFNNLANTLQGMQLIAFMTIKEKYNVV